MVETSRLHIFPLTAQDLDLYLRGNDLFEQAHQLALTGRSVSKEVHKMVTGFTLPRMQQTSGDHYLFFTFWLVVEKSTRIVVAELGFKGEPNLRGEVEIGYGTMPGRQREGFMTEAVGGMIQWAVQRQDIHTILAETDERNIPSIKVLQKNGFRQYDRKENMLWWKIATLPAQP